MNKRNKVDYNLMMGSDEPKQYDGCVIQVGDNDDDTYVVGSEYTMLFEAFDDALDQYFEATGISLGRNECMLVETFKL